MLIFWLLMSLAATSDAAFQSDPYVPFFDTACPGDSDTGDCRSVTELFGPEASGDDTSSSVTCPSGQFVMFCECVITAPGTSGSYCDGVFIHDSATRCQAWGASGGGSHKARVVCGRVTGRVILRSNPENTYASNTIQSPSVACEPGQVVLGCYAHTWWPEIHGPAVAIMRGQLCATATDCARCRVQAVCLAPEGGTPAANCACLSYATGNTKSNAFSISTATCPTGQSVTSCRCVALTAGARCNGVTIDGSECSAYVTATGESIAARACCGRLAGTVQVRDAAAATTSGPAASCSTGHQLLSCFSYSAARASYENDSPMKPFISGNSCSLPDTCAGCHLQALCQHRLCPINGGWSITSTETGCSEPCGGGSKTRTRWCNNPTPEHGGLECLLPDGVTRALIENTPLSCNTQPCPVNGGWSVTATETGCDQPCGGGSKTRTRWCNNPTPEHGGLECLLPDGVTRALIVNTVLSCNTQPCPVNGGWSSWSGYGACSLNCGGGTQSESRQCNNPTPANNGDECTLLDGSTGFTETRSRGCNPQPCPVDGGWSVWSGYGACSLNCGGGTQSESRQCNNPVPANNGDECTLLDGSTGFTETRSRGCNPQPCPVDGGWSLWSGYDACSVDCGGGTQSESRQCNNPVPANNGAECTLLDGSTGFTETRSQACNIQPCPVHGGWSLWSGYGACSVNCGGGTQSESRLCNNPVPANNGDECTLLDGSTGLSETRSQACNTQPCVVDGGWSAWNVGVCTETCGDGLRVDTRTCDNPAPANGGANCPGFDILLSTCNDGPCPGGQPAAGWEERRNTAVCSLYVTNLGTGQQLVGINSELPTSRAHAATLDNCSVECANRSMTCQMSLKLYLNYSRRSGRQEEQVHAFQGCRTKYANVCCCVE